MKTNKKKKVLIALDYDPSAHKVAKIGFSIANALNAEVILLHIISNPEHYSSTKHIKIMGFVGSDDIVPLKLDSVDELKKVAQQFLDKSKDLLGDKTIQTLLKEGESADSILKASKDLHVNLIIMGSYSRKWLENRVMGSVTEIVLHYTSIPLFIIPIKKQD
jgi:nucleotide-binding universal stress UspA family protein